MITDRNGGVLVDVKAKPGSHSDKLEWDGEVLKVKVRAKPVDGEANSSLIVLLSKSLGVPKSSISIEKGASGRHKKVGITGLNRDQFLERVKS